MLLHLKQRAKDDTAESGFVLILSLVILLMLSLFGIWAMQTSKSELDIAGAEQRIEKEFNIAEGAANAEAGNVGFNLQNFYAINNPSLFNQLKLPTTDGDFNPGNDANIPLVAALPAYPPNTLIETNPNFWPSNNLLNNNSANANELDYRYLVTYLYPDTPPMGYDTNLFSGYKFRVQGAPIRQNAVVELGGNKVGVKASL